MPDGLRCSAHRGLMNCGALTRPPNREALRAREALDELTARRSTAARSANQHQLAYFAPGDASPTKVARVTLAEAEDAA